MKMIQVQINLQHCRYLSVLFRSPAGLVVVTALQNVFLGGFNMLHTIFLRELSAQ